MFRPGLETEVGVAVGKAVPYRHVEVRVVEQQLQRKYTGKKEEVKKKRVRRLMHRRSQSAVRRRL